jgi:hypothetical protein
LVFLDVLAHLRLTEPLAADGIDGGDIKFAPLMYFVKGFTWIKGKGFFVFVFSFGYRDIDCLGLLNRNLLLNFVVFSVFGLNWVGVTLQDIRVLKLIEIEHSLSKY